MTMFPRAPAPGQMGDIPNYVGTFHTLNGSFFLRLTNTDFPEDGAIWFESPMYSNAWTICGDKSEELNAAWSEPRYVANRDDPL